MNRYPIATCVRCEHKIFDDDGNHDSRSFVDCSGNTSREYYHLVCPKHKLQVRMIIVRKDCLDYGAHIEERHE